MMLFVSGVAVGIGLSFLGIYFYSWWLLSSRDGPMLTTEW